MFTLLIVSPVHTFAPKLINPEERPRLSKDKIIVTMVDVDFSRNEEANKKGQGKNRNTLKNFNVFKDPLPQ